MNIADIGYAVVFFALLGALILVTIRAKRGKTQGVREAYAFKCVWLLLGLAADIALSFSGADTPWSIVAGVLEVRNTQSLAELLINRLAALVIFAICVLVVLRTHKNWRGEISRRQFRMNTQQLEDSGLLLDFLTIAAALFRRNSELKAHQPCQTGDCAEDTAVDTWPWNLEFAKIYSILSNQANIDVIQDWHPQYHCYVSTYAGTHKIAIYCTEFMPEAQNLDAFLTYIRQLNKTYLKVLVAVKENPDRLEDYTAALDGSSITYLFKDNCLDQIADFQGYFRAADRLYHTPLLQGASQCIDDVYVEPSCTVGTGNAPVSLHEYVHQWLQQEQTRQLALLGDYGQGKTLFATHLTQQMIKSNAARIPILIPLRNKSPRNSSPMEILSYFASQYGINPEALNILNANGRLLLIFDGFDEMDLVGNDDIRKMHFRSLWKLVAPRSKVLITGRPNYFLNPAELDSALGTRPESVALPHCVPLHLQPFTAEQIKMALRSSAASVQAGILRIIESKTSTLFLDLISRPSHLFLVSQIWEARDLAQKYQNLTSATIINEFLQSCFARQSAKCEREPYYFLSPLEREYFMVGIAVKMYKLGVTSLARDLFYDTIRELIDLFPERLSAGNTSFISLRNGKSVQAFAGENPKCFDSIVNDVRVCGVLVNDYQNDGFMFAHKSFFDLLVAKFFLGKSLKTHDSAMEIAAALSGTSSYHIRLKNDLVIRKLLAELIATKISVSLVNGGDEVKCQKIFDQCFRIIAGRRIKSTPQRMFVRRIKKSGTESREDTSLVLQKKEIFRLFYVFALFLFCLVMFVVRAIHLTARVGERAVNAFDALPSNLSPDTSFMGLLDFRVIFGALILCSFLLVLHLCLRLPAGKGDLILLTWYYTCLDNHIPERVILKQLSPAYRCVFRDYILGHNLAEIQEKLAAKQQKKRRPKKQQSM